MSDVSDATKGRPNLLFVFSDQHRWCDLGCYGNRQVISPNFDAFAETAVQFDHCISNSPLCVPARGTLLTGLYALKHGAAGNDLPLRGDVETFGHVLAANGYRTGYIGKWHLAGVPRDQFIPAERRFGFREWKAANCTHNYMHSYYDDEENRRFPIAGYEPVVQTGLALDFIARNAGNPWGLVLSWGPPHDPYDAVPERYLNLYKDVEIKLRDNVGETSLAIKGTATRDEVIEDIRGYYAHITALDEQFGRLLKQLELTGQLENTIIVYTSDHGDMLGSQGQFNKQLPYEESVRVPLLVRWQGRTLAARRQDLISLVDLPVSLLGLMGLRYSGEVDGEDLHKLFTDEQSAGREDCYIYDLTACHYSQRRGTPQWRGVRTQRYTYAKSVADGPWLLYDNAADPYQLRNLAGLPGMERIQAELDRKVHEYAERHDGFLPWEELAAQAGLQEKWEESERYFSPEFPK